MENQKHVHTFEEIVMPATCQQQGYTLHRCACGYEYKDNFKPSGNHTFQVTEQLDPTCTTTGQQTLCCTVCGATEVRPISALGHSFGKWNVETMPSCTEEGAQFRTCDRCGTTEEQIIKAKGHKLTNRRKSATQKGVTEYFCANCGQTVQKERKPFNTKKFVITIAAILAVLALLIGVCLAVLPSVMGQAYSYYAAKFMIAIGQYEKAYYLLQDCVEKEIYTNFNFTAQTVITGYYKDTEEILSDFLLVCEEHTTIYAIYADGERTDKEEVICDEDEGEITYTTTQSFSDGKRVTERVDLYEDGLLATRTYYNADGNVTEKYEYEYDKDGNTTLEVYYGADGNITDKDEYEYDKDGNMTLEVDYDADGNITEKWEYEYDKDGNKTLSVQYDADGNVEYKYEYEYDKDGNMTLKVRYDADGNITDKDEYEYDKDGNMTLSGGYGAQFRYKYDKDGNKTLAVCYHAEGIVMYKDKYEYDKDGNLTLQVYYGSDGTVRHKYEYEYDKDGNKTLAVRYDADGEKVNEEKWEGYQVIYLPKFGK